jgi:acetylornithine deacetylase/succinyl-diaminopimelate desuccinylase-like protein
LVPNPAWTLVRLLNTMLDADNRVLIPGFYDDVRPPLPDEERAIAQLPDESEQTARSLEIPSLLLRVCGAEYQRHHLFDPTCNIAGLSAGYEGPGPKTVLPAMAMAKVDFRLVPEQRPDDILAKLRRHLDAHGFRDIETRVLSAEAPARTPLSAPFVTTVAEAGRAVYGIEPLLVPTMAGTGPLHAFTEALGMASADCGVGYPDGRIHAPDEHIRLDDMRRNIHHIAALLERMGAG